MTPELVASLASLVAVAATGAGVVWKLSAMSTSIDQLSKRIEEHRDTRERIAALEAVVFDRGRAA